MGNVRTIQHTKHYLFETKILMNTYFLLTCIFGVAISSEYPYKKSIFTSFLFYIGVFFIFIPFSLLYLDFIFYNHYYLEMIAVGFYGWGDYDDFFKVKIYSVFIACSIILITTSKILEKKFILLRLKKTEKENLWAVKAT